MNRKKSCECDLRKVKKENENIYDKDNGRYKVGLGRGLRIRIRLSTTKKVRVGFSIKSTGWESSVSCEGVVGSRPIQADNIRKDSRMLKRELRVESILINKSRFRRPKHSCTFL